MQCTDARQIAKIASQQAPLTADRWQPSKEQLPPPPPPPLLQDPALDFLSPQFDALRALRTQGLAPPEPDAPPLDNITKCRRLLPAELPESHAAALARRRRAAPPSEDGLARAARSRQLSSGARAKSRGAADAGPTGSNTILTLARIAVCAGAAGPLALLGRCFAECSRVRVVTRHARGVRGAATGELRGFDHLMNLVLADVEEHYLVRLRVVRAKLRLACGPPPEDGAPPEFEEVQRMGWRQERRTRRLAQVVLRGDSIVLIARWPVVT
ncbi:hypothetical protein WJX81_001418 [Elliptochloris bilobata]|uniref:Sm domain-containing protein n=1 Tax=Elliptochloris bilobata TaxID=381761 RepID=A0AAW1R9W6_9CHLO